MHIVDEMERRNPMLSIPVNEDVNSIWNNKNHLSLYTRLLLQVIPINNRILNNKKSMPTYRRQQNISKVKFWQQSGKRRLQVSVVRGDPFCTGKKFIRIRRVDIQLYDMQETLKFRTSIHGAIHYKSVRQNRWQNLNVGPQI